MSQLISGRGAGRTMSSREIAMLCEARHNDVVATIERLFAKGLLRSSRKSRTEQTGGRPLEVFDLCQRDTALVVAGYSDEFRARVIDRWEELESQTPALPSFPELLRQHADLLEANLATEARLALAAPKAAFVDQYVAAQSGSKSFREVCKLLQINEAEFRVFLQDKKIMYRLNGSRVPYAEHLAAGRFEVKAGLSREGHAFNTSLFTAKGIEWVAAQWAKARQPMTEVA